MLRLERLLVANLGQNSKLESLRREIRADVKKQDDLFVNNLVGDIEVNPRDFSTGTSINKTNSKSIKPLLKEEKSQRFGRSVYGFFKHNSQPTPLS